MAMMYQKFSFPSAITEPSALRPHLTAEPAEFAVQRTAETCLICFSRFTATPLPFRETRPEFEGDDR